MWGEVDMVGMCVRVGLGGSEGGKGVRERREGAGRIIQRNQSRSPQLALDRFKNSSSKFKWCDSTQTPPSLISLPSNSPAWHAQLSPSTSTTL